MRALLVVNPFATRTTVRTRDVLVHALADELRSVEIVVTDHPGHARELGARAAAEGFDYVVTLGGDGTVNEVVNGLLADGPRPGLPVLATVPGGSANVFARALGLPNDPVEATGQLLEAIREGRRRAVGLGTADDRWFTFNAGVGLDAEVVREVERRSGRGSTKGPMLYVRTGVEQFFRSDRRRSPITVTTADGTVTEGLDLLLVCNTSPWTYLGDRPVIVCPGAGFDDRLDAVGVRQLTPLRTLWHVQQILRPTGPRGGDVVRFADEPSLDVTCDTPMAVQIDGEPLPPRSAWLLRAWPGALEVLV